MTSYYIRIDNENSMEFWMELRLTIEDDNSINVNQLNGRTKWDPVIGQQQRIAGPRQWHFEIEDNVIRINNDNALSFWMELELDIDEGLLNQVDVQGRTTWDVHANDLVCSDKQWCVEFEQVENI